MPDQGFGLTEPDDQTTLGTKPTLADGWGWNSKTYRDWVDEQRKSGVASGLLDEKTGLPTPAALADAVKQYGAALMGSTSAPGFGRVAPGDAALQPMDPVKHMMRHIAADPKAKWGLRIVPDPIEGPPGTVLPPSRVWDDGAPTSELLNGTSTIGIKGAKQQHIEDALKTAGVAPYGKPWGYYPGEHVYLVKGDKAMPGYDDGESIIADPQLVAGYRKVDDGPSALLPVKP